VTEGAESLEVTVQVSKDYYFCILVNRIVLTCGKIRLGNRFVKIQMSLASELISMILGEILCLIIVIKYR